jgi:hypothetical protein
VKRDRKDGNVKRDRKDRIKNERADMSSAGKWRNERQNRKKSTERPTGKLERGEGTGKAEQEGTDGKDG